MPSLISSQGRLSAVFRCRGAGGLEAETEPLSQLLGGNIAWEHIAGIVTMEGVPLTPNRRPRQTVRLPGRLGSLSELFADCFWRGSWPRRIA